MKGSVTELNDTSGPESGGDMIVVVASAFAILAAIVLECGYVRSFPKHNQHPLEIEDLYTRQHIAGNCVVKGSNLLQFDKSNVMQSTIGQSLPYAPGTSNRECKHMRPC
eukprot:6483877-Amphidinium_carterae.1